MLLSSSKQKKAQEKGNRILVTINVLGSAGPLRFVVYERELVANIISMVLKKYAKEGRLPVLGSNIKDFYLYSPAAESDILSPWETIGAYGGRSFIMCKKPQPSPTAAKVESAGKRNTAADDDHVTKTRRKRGILKAWINKSLISFKIPAH